MSTLNKGPRQGPSSSDSRNERSGRSGRPGKPEASSFPEFDSGQGEPTESPRPQQGVSRAGWSLNQEPLWRHDRRPAWEQQDQPRRANEWWRKEPLIASDVMRRNLATVHTKSSAQEIAEIMRKEDVAFVAIVDEQGRLLGLVTDRDIVVRGIAGRGSLEGLKAEDLSSTDVETASPETPVHEILQRMGAEHIRPALVVDGEGRLLGQLSIGDIAKRADQDEQLQEAFAQLSGRRSFWNRLWR